MVRVSVILVEPKFTGNIGAVARVMKNFGFTDLILIDPTELDDEALCRAKHAGDILKDAQRIDSLEEITGRFDMMVGTTGIDTEKEKEVLRQTEEPFEFAQSISDYRGHVGLVFGREDYGLYNHELALCDRVVTIPTAPEYPILNLSHAVCVLLYTIYIEELGKDTSDDEGDYMGDNEKERMIEIFSDIIDKIDYPDYKKEKAVVTLRRIFGKGNATLWDYHRIMGVLSRIDKKL